MDLEGNGEGERAGPLWVNKCKCNILRQLGKHLKWSLICYHCVQVVVHHVFGRWTRQQPQEPQTQTDATPSCFPFLTLFSSSSFLYFHPSQRSSADSVCGREETTFGFLSADQSASSAPKRAPRRCYSLFKITSLAVL